MTSCGNGVLDGDIEPAEIVRCLHNKIGGSDGFVGELLKYGWYICYISCFLCFGMRR